MGNFRGHLSLPGEAFFLMFRQQTTPETAGFVFPLWARPKFQT